MNKLERHYTVKEVADLRLLWYGAMSIRRLIKEKKLRAITIKAGKTVSIKIPESAIKEFLETNAI